MSVQKQQQQQQKPINFEDIDMTVIRYELFIPERFDMLTSPHTMLCAFPFDVTKIAQSISCCVRFFAH